MRWRIAGLVALAAAACRDDAAPVDSVGSTGDTAPATTLPLDDSGGDTTGLDSTGTSEGGSDTSTTGEAPVDTWDCGPQLGARFHDDGDLEVRVRAPRATRIEVALFDTPLGASEVLRLPLSLEGDVHRLRIDAEVLTDAELSASLHYGFRVWGDNWPYDEAWEPGSEAGWIADVDEAGNRMNPNKLVLDPYALEVSHDPLNPEHTDLDVFSADEDNRMRDSGPFAPKGVVIGCEDAMPGPERPLRDDVVYEVHLRGLTMSDPMVPEEERGTYAGAARKAAELAELGVTAIELLPLHETPNDQNELSPEADGDNYWGYSSLSYFAPDRRYAADQSPGGPTRELRAMIDAFHAEGIKVYADVVYNHTAEGGGSRIYSWRGLDNATFYELDADGSGYVVSNGVGPNVNTADPVVADLVLASLHYMHAQLGFDGYRFDLAAVVANGCTTECYEYDPSLPERIADELARPADGGAGVDLIAEAWGVGPGTYQVGNFPAGWAEWNDHYRDSIRRDLNRLGERAQPVRAVVRAVEGSPDLYGDDGRGPGASINFVVAHDGMTLHDLFRYDDKDNEQAWPYGPSSGGSDQNLASSHAGDPIQQATVTRTAAALLLVSAGVPMMTGGDESGRSLQGNNNPFNLDNEANWLRWPGDPAYDEAVAAFTAGMLAFRHAHAALRPAAHWGAAIDEDGDGLTQVRWLRDDGTPVDDAYLDDDFVHFIAWQLDGDELGDAAASLYFAYNGWSDSVLATIPEPPADLDWRRVIDTSPQGDDFGHVLSGGPIIEGSYSVAARSLVVLVAE